MLETWKLQMSILLASKTLETLSQAGWTFRAFEETEFGRKALIINRQHEQKMQNRTNLLLPKLFAAAISTLGAVYSPITLLASAGILASMYKERTETLKLKNKITEFYQAQARYVFAEDIKQNIRHLNFIISTTERSQIKSVSANILKMWDSIDQIEKILAPGCSEQDLHEFIASRKAIAFQVQNLKTKATGNKQKKAYETAKKDLQTALNNLNGTGDAPGILNKIAMSTQNQIPRLQASLNLLF